MLSILRVGDVFQPVHALAVERFGNSKVCHRFCRRRAVPMLFPRGNPDHVALVDFLPWSALGLSPALARCDNQSLSKRMRVHAVRAAGSNVTKAPATRAGASP